MPEDWEGFPLRKDYPVQIRMTPHVERAAAGDRGGVPREPREGSADARTSELRDAVRRDAGRDDRAARAGEARRSAAGGRRGGGDRRGARTAAASCCCSATAAAPPTRSTSPRSWSDAFERERAALAAIALTTDTSVLTSVGNDYAFERVFARQVEGARAAAATSRLGISTSGASPNVVAGARSGAGARAADDRAHRRRRRRGRARGGDSRQRAVGRRRRACRKCIGRCCT